MKSQYKELTLRQKVINLLVIEDEPTLDQLLTLIQRERSKATLQERKRIYQALYNKVSDDYKAVLDDLTELTELESLLEKQ